MTIEEKLKSLNITLPKAPDPVGAYVASKISGNLIFISGQISLRSDGKLISGKVGKDLNLEEAQNAAKIWGLNILSQLKKICGGSLDKVKSCIKLTGYVNSLINVFKKPNVELKFRFGKISINDSSSKPLLYPDEEFEV